jgi:hypothetical protein
VFVERDMMRQIGKQPLHDFVIRSIPELWEKRGRQSIEINPGSEKNRSAKFVDLYPDVMGFESEQGQGRLQWVAEVETEDTITLRKARTQWRQSAALGVPFYVIVPIGFRDLAALIALHEGVPVAGFYHYWFENQKLRLIGHEGVGYDSHCA